MRMILIATAAALLLGACGSLRSAMSAHDNADHAHSDYLNGVKNYEGGDYTKAAELLKDALYDGLSDKNDQVIAHKYLAFINCFSAHEKACRSEFRKAFEIDPAFKLGPAEDGHPLWTPVYLEVKKEFAHSGSMPPP